MPRWTGLIVLALATACASTPNRVAEDAPATKSERGPASTALDSREVFTFKAQGSRWGSKFKECIYRDTHDRFSSVTLDQFLILTDAGGYAQRDDYDGVDGVVPCPKLVQREGNLGYDVVVLTRFRREEQGFQCEYKVRGDTYLCALLAPANYGH